MKLMKTEYDRSGELQKPALLDHKLRAAYCRSHVAAPTFDMGHFHYFEIRAENERQLRDRLASFMAKLDRAGGDVLDYSDETAPAIEGRYNGLMGRITYVVMEPYYRAINTAA